MEMAQSIKPVVLRLEDDLRLWLKHRAVDNHRSVSGELRAILTKAREQEQNPEARQ